MPHCPTPLLNTTHKDTSISDNAMKIPETFSCCKETNSKVSAVDWIAKKYTVQTATRRQ